jgi:hypothetical protein
MRLLRNRTFGVLILCVPVVIIISLSKPNSLKTNNKVESDRFWTYKVHSRKKFNMLIIGDSRVYRGISPQAISKVMPGIKISNFGFSSGILNNEMYSEAYNRIDQNSEHKIILVGISPGSLTDYENDHFHSIRKMTNSEIIDKMYINYFVSKFLTPIKPSELFSDETQLPPDNIKEVFYDNGWVASTSEESNHFKNLDSYKIFWETNKVSKSRINDLYLKIAEWTKNGVDVFTFRAPASKEIDSLENGLSGFNENELRDHIRKNGGHWIFLDSSYNRYQSYDGCHLNAKSAMLLSEDLALEMNKVELMKNDQ